MRKRFRGSLFVVFVWFSFCASAADDVRGIRINRTVPIPHAGAARFGYNDDWALIVGIDKYKHYPPLATAVRGAKAVAKKLQAEFNFNPKNIIELYNLSATKDSIEYYLKDYFVKRAGPEDRLLVYFGGHGDTYESFTSKQGYICPYETDKDRLPSTGISMTSIKEYNAILNPKHIYYVLDCCFSGTAFLRGAPPNLPPTEKYYEKFFASKSRLALSAGESDELVEDVGPDGKYSPFTYYFLEALDAPEVADQYGVIRATSIGAYVSKKVLNLTEGRQNPISGPFENMERQEFVFWRQPKAKVLQDGKFQNVKEMSTPLHKAINFQVKNYAKKYFLIIYWQSTCLPCHAEIKFLSTEKLPESMQVITINTDAPNNLRNITNAKNFILKYDRFLNLFLSEETQISGLQMELSIKSYPLTILVDSEMRLMYSREGFDASAEGKSLLLKEIKSRIQ